METPHHTQRELYWKYGGYISTIAARELNLTGQNIKRQYYKFICN